MKCGYQPEDRRYAPCAREAGHEGPCAHDFDWALLRRRRCRNLMILFACALVIGMIGGLLIRAMFR